MYARRKSELSLANADGSNSIGHRVSTAELVDFIKEQALRRTIKEVARLTGLSEQAVKNLRLGEAGASAQTVSTWCRNDHQFRIEYFRWCGGLIETDPEMAANLSRVITDHVRRFIQPPGGHSGRQEEERQRETEHV